MDWLQPPLQPAFLSSPNKGNVECDVSKNATSANPMSLRDDGGMAEHLRDKLFNRQR